MKKKILLACTVGIFMIIGLTGCKKQKETNINWNHAEQETVENTSTSGLPSDVMASIQNQLHLALSDSIYLNADDKTKEQMLGNLIVSLFKQNLIESDYAKTDTGYNITSNDGHNLTINYDGNIIVK